MRKLLLAAIAVALVAVTGYLAPPAYAAAVCDEAIVDNAKVLKDGRSLVEGAVQKLSGIGADVRVRTIPSLGGRSTLDDYIEDQQKACGSWQSTDGGRKNNLLVFAMSLKDRKVGIFYGEKWRAAFEDSGGEGRIWSQFMGPRFADGEFAEGFADGMNESYRVINEHLRPSQGGGPTVVVDEEPTDWGGVAKVVGIIFGSLLLIFLVVVAIVVFRQRAEEREKKKVARQRALRARDAATQLLQEVGDDTRKAVRLSKVDKYSAVGTDTAGQLAEALEDADAYYSAATEGLSSAASASATADDHDLTAGEYLQMAERYEEVLEHANAAKAADERIDHLCAGIEARHQRASSDMELLESGLTELDGALQSLRSEGIKTEVVETFVTATTDALSLAREKAADLSCLPHLAEAQEHLEGGRTAHQNLVQQRQQLSQGIPALQARIQGVEVELAEARKCFDRISGTYAESSWKSVRGNGTEAEKRIQAAGEALSAAQSHSDLSEQQWDEAINAVQQGNQLLEEAQSLLRSITTLETNLHKAKKQAPQEIKDAESDIAKAESYIAANDDDIREELEGDLEKAKGLLRQAGEELALQPPDYLKVMKLASRANSAADSILAEAIDEHETAERLRRQAASTLQQAAAAVSRAEEFIQDHSSDVSVSPVNGLEDAVDELQRAKLATDPAEVLRYAGAALEFAEEAYRAAENEFEEEERARRRRRTAAASASAGSSYSGGSSYDSGFGGGSSGSWGSFGGGGGSSGSFGGGGGGGSSGGW